MTGCLRHEGPAALDRLVAGTRAQPSEPERAALVVARQAMQRDRERIREVDVTGIVPAWAPPASLGANGRRDRSRGDVRARRSAEPGAGATPEACPVADRSMTAVLAALRNGEIGSEELTLEYLERADARNERLGVYITRFDQAALEAARAADRNRRRGRLTGPLHGLPLAVKDAIATLEAPTTCQSRLPALLGAGADAPAIARLRAAGAVILGKVTLSEFACGPPTLHSGYPLPRNPWDPLRRPGGSSSGSAAGVAGGLFPAAIGTDTGGSIRMPAALCGVTGFKPTLGVVPTAGVVPLAWSSDTIGPIARTAHDCRLMLEVLAGPPREGGTRSQEGLAGMRIGVDRPHLDLGDPDSPVDRVFESALRVLGDAGADLVPIAMRNREAICAAGRLILMSEAFSAHEGDLARFWKLYMPATRVSLLSGACCSAADYLRALRVRAAAQIELGRLFDDVDVVVSPTVAAEAPRYGAFDDSLSEYHDTVALLGRAHTMLWNAVGFPALNVPMGPGGEGMPLGLQIAGRPFSDDMLLSVGAAYQRLTTWHERRPAG